MKNVQQAITDSFIRRGQQHLNNCSPLNVIVGLTEALVIFSIETRANTLSKAEASRRVQKLLSVGYRRYINGDNSRKKS